MKALAVNALPHKARRQHVPAPARRSGDAVVEIAVIGAHTGATLLDTLVHPRMSIQARVLFGSPRPIADWRAAARKAARRQRMTENGDP
ncbi:hypothetical protein [Micromonospora avicenniae]|uniref:hypothetical protein n=1 Tax=Micromonospora avicenniae TaxID=1198245 RepID=UPI0034223C06